MAEPLDTIAAAIERIARSVETLAASQRVIAEQLTKRSIDDEIAKERTRNEAA